MRALRSVLSVLAGVVAWGLLWVTSNGALASSLPGFYHEDGTTDHTGLLLSSLAVSIVCSLLAGFLTATLAPNRPQRHVAVLAVMQLAIGGVVQAPYFDTLPVWYNAILLLLVVPGHLLGGRLRTARRAAVGVSA